MSCMTCIFLPSFWSLKPFPLCVDTQSVTHLMCIVWQHSRSLQSFLLLGSLYNIYLFTVLQISSVLSIALALSLSLIWPTYPIAVLEIPPPINVKPGDQLRATATYVADNTQENAMHLVEGEKVYVQGECIGAVASILVSNIGKFLF